jgi:MFS family permease
LSKTETARRGVRFPDSIEGRPSWVAASLTLAILSVSYGAPLVVVVGLKPIADSLGADRSVVALAASLVWLGTGFGGIFMGWIADRIGMRPIAVFGALMTALGLAVSAIGQTWALVFGSGVLIGLLGNSAHFPPLVTYVSRWFDRRRGTAVALISAGQYLAGMVWPAIFERGMVEYGWQATMLGFAVVTAAAIVPLALFLRPPPHPGSSEGTRSEAAAQSQSGSGIAVHGGVPVLRPDGDAGGTSRGLVQRSRDPGGARRSNVVCVARLRLF